MNGKGKKDDFVVKILRNCIKFSSGIYIFHVKTFFKLREEVYAESKKGGKNERKGEKREKKSRERNTAKSCT